MTATAQEIAIKYGVPLPQTCQELDFRNETIFVWAKKYINVVHNLFDWHLITYTEYQKKQQEYDYCGYLAPQIHEIAPLLDLCELYQFKTGFELGYTQLSGEYIHFNEGIHFAEMYAKMYIWQRNNKKI